MTIISIREEIFMNFDFSRYPYRNIFPEELTSNLTYGEAVPNNYEQGKVEKVDGEVLYDFGVESIGFFTIEAKGKGELIIDYAEWLDEMYDRHEDTIPCWYIPPVDRFSIDSKEFVRVKINGRRVFRFLRIRAEGNIEIRAPHLKTVQAKNPYDGTFYCSDQRVNDLYEISKRTIKLCMQDFVEDGIKRDGLCWITDTRVGMYANYRVFGNTDIIKKCIVYFIRTMKEDGWISTSGIIGGAHQHPSNIDYMFDFVTKKSVEGTPEFYRDCGEIYYIPYQADFLGMVYEYYQYSGDKVFLEKIWSFVKRIAEYLGTLTDEMINKYHFPIQPKDNRELTDNLCDVGSVYASLVYGLKDYVKLCKVFGTKTDEENITPVIERFSKKALEFLDDKKRMFRDCDNAYSPTALAFMYLAGLCSGQDLINGLKAMPKDKTAYPDHGMVKHWILKALFEAGYISEALKWMKEEWYPLLDYGYTTCIERWDIEDMEDTLIWTPLSACHAWSSGPADFLIRFVLGVQQVDDGFNIVKISPNLSGLKYAFGTVPTPKGLIKVRVVNGKVEYHVPNGVEVVK